MMLLLKRHTYTLNMTLSKIIVCIGLFFTPLFAGNNDLTAMGISRQISAIVSYAVDLNKDKKNDIVALFKLPTGEGLELLVLLNDGKSYITHKLMTFKHTPYLTIQGDYNNRYIEVINPENSSLEFHWIKDKFVEKWTAD